MVLEKTVPEIELFMGLLFIKLRFNELVHCVITIEILCPLLLYLELKTTVVYTLQELLHKT